jgi:hypothetical protein
VFQKRIEQHIRYYQTYTVPLEEFLANYYQSYRKIKTSFCNELAAFNIKSSLELHGQDLGWNGGMKIITTFESQVLM